MSGKGINVARALKTLAAPVVATGLAGGRTGTRIIEELTHEAILNDFVRISTDSRTSTAVVDPTSGTYTEINEWGPEVTEAELTGKPSTEITPEHVLGLRRVAQHAPGERQHRRVARGGSAEVSLLTAYASPPMPRSR